MIVKSSTFLYVIPFFVLLFQQAVVRNTTGIVSEIFSFFDEIYVVFLFLRLIQKNGIRKLQNNKNDFFIFSFWCVFLIVGLMSNIVNRYVSISWGIFDAFICSKFIIVYFALKYSVGSKVVLIKIAKQIAKICRICIVAFFILTFVNIFVPVFPRAEYRFFMESIQLFFGHPTFYAATAITCVGALIASESYEHKRNNEIFIYMGLFCVASTLRMKAVAASLGVLFLYLYFIKFGFRNVKVAFLMAGIVIFCLVYDQIQFYYGGNYLYDDNFVRERMLQDSIIIANQHLPLGSGFGSFASDIAKKAQTQLYSIYGYKLDSKYLTDSFWPIITAQCGWIGVLAFCGTMVNLIKNILKLLKIDKKIFCSSCSLLLYLLICSLGETAFFHPVCVPMFLIMGVNSRIIK